jgi:outer membrane protein TolC
MKHRVITGLGVYLLWSLCLFPVLSVADEQAVLPQPLTLPLALQYAGKPDQFQIQIAEQNLEEALANASFAQSNDDVTVNLSGRLRKVGVSEAGDEDEDNDSLVSLFVRKPLYDFGRTGHQNQLAELTVQLRQLEKAYVIEQRELTITQKFFDVLNADNEYLRHNEDLAIGYIQFDKARENQELGLASEIEVLEKQAAYEVIRQNRYHSENQQRLTREILAEELGFTGQPPSDVVLPELVAATRITDDVQKLVTQAFRHSLRLKIQQKKLDIAMQAVTVAQHSVGPSLDAELEVSDYAREGATRDDWRASIYFDVPLYYGGRRQSKVDVANARYRQALSELLKVRSEIRVEVLQLWQAIKQNSVRIEGEAINQEYREMYLDRSRAEYELEFKTDLGDAMVQFSDSRMKAYQARFALEMAWRKLEKLIGTEYFETLQQDENQNG